MNDIEQFMQMAVQDQMNTAGHSCVVTAGKPRNYTLECKAVITSRDGSMDAEVGGTLISITGHALIQMASISQAPKPGDRISVKGSDDEWLMTNVISSPNDRAYSCDLVRTK